MCLHCIITGMYVNFDRNNYYPCQGSLKQNPLGSFIRERPTKNNMPRDLFLPWHLVLWIISHRQVQIDLQWDHLVKLLNWNFNPCTRLWPLYTALCISPGRTNRPNRAIHKTKAIIQGGTFCEHRICIDLKTSWVKNVVIVLGYFVTMEVVDEVNHCATNHTHHRDRMTKARN